METIRRMAAFGSSSWRGHFDHLDVFFGRCTGQLEAVLWTQHIEKTKDEAGGAPKGRNQGHP